MKWNAQDIVAIILSLVIVLAVVGAVAYSVGYGEHITAEGSEWIGKLLLVIVGALTMFMGIKHNNNKDL